VLAPAWLKALTPANLVAGFEASGLWPFNPSRVKLPLEIQHTGTVLHIKKLHMQNSISCIIYIADNSTPLLAKPPAEMPAVTPAETTAGTSDELPPETPTETTAGTPAELPTETPAETFTASSSDRGGATEPPGNRP